MTVLFIAAYIAIGIISASIAVVCYAPEDAGGDGSDKVEIGFLAFVCAVLWPIVTVVFGFMGLLWLWMTLLNR